MPNHHAAFETDEYVRLADADTLQKLQDGREWPYRLPAGIAQYAGVRARIRSIGCFHGGLMLYEFDGIPGHWIEPTFRDLSFDPPTLDPPPIYRPACETYIASTNVASGPGWVMICDHSDRLFRQSHHTDAVETAASINEVARIRARSSFEHRYGFDGIYPPNDESPIEAPSS